MRKEEVALRERNSYAGERRHREKEEKVDKGKLEKVIGRDVEERNGKGKPVKKKVEGEIGRRQKRLEVLLSGRSAGKGREKEGKREGFGEVRGNG